MGKLLGMERATYPTDLTDAQWEDIIDHIRAPKLGGRPPLHSRREILNAIFYIVRSGCAWRLLPADFPPWKTVYHYFRCWRIDGSMEKLNAALRTEVRQKAGREPQPSAAIIESQSVKTTSVGGPRGFDGWKPINGGLAHDAWASARGRKRHIVVDVMGLLLTVVVHAANIADCVGARRVLKKGNGVWSRLQLVWADGSYTGPLIQWVKDKCGWILEIIKPTPNASDSRFDRMCGWWNGHLGGWGSIVA